MANSFSGQQTDELILYFTKPHKLMKYFAFLQILLIGVFVMALLFYFQGTGLGNSPLLGVIAQTGLAFTIIMTILSLWWVKKVFDETELYITDRRAVKFAPIAPFRNTMRSLFWDEAVKIKTYYKSSILDRLLGFGSVEIHAKYHNRDNIDIDHIIFHEDLGHYVDKILFVYKSSPEDVKNIKQFVPKPAGQRG